VVIGFFSWPYIGRIVRGQTIALRDREFVDAARSLGARPGRIIVRELMPNLLAPILVYTTLLIPANILFEAGLSFLGVGVKDPTPSWGAMINSAIGTFQIDPEYLIVPGTAIFITVLAFNLLGDGLRDAFDPKGSR
jgi:ABC-type dipeptide/oligopeptide/nickel transport system permease subunit